MNIIVTIDGEDKAFTKREASSVYNQLGEALHPKIERKDEKKEKIIKKNDVYQLY